MTSNHHLLYRLAELMLENERHILPVDLLFDDEQIGDFVKSIQIDSPYQQMILEGVLTESVIDEKLYVSYTVEGYFHYILGEVIRKQTEGKEPGTLKQIIEENKLNGANEGVEHCLILFVEKDDLSKVIWMIDRCENNLHLFTLPISTAFQLANFQNNSKELFINIIKELLKNHSDSDLIVLENVLSFLIKSQRHETYMKLALCLFETDLPENIRGTKLKLHAIKNLDNSIRKTQLKKIYRQLSSKNLKGHNANIYIELGLGFRFISEYTTSLSCFQIALDILANNVNEISIRCHNSLGLINSDLGNYSVSLNHLYFALKMTERLNGKGHFSTYNNHNHIGSILHLIDPGNIIKAIKHLKKGLKLATCHFGAYHTETAIIYNNLGIAFSKKNDYRNAEINYLAGFEIFQAIYPKNDPWIATVCNNLASLYYKKRELQKALKFQKEAIDIITHNGGIQDIMTAIMQSTYANILRLLDQKNEAIENYQKTIETFRNKLPTEHLYLQKAYSNLGFVQMENGSFKSAIKSLLLSFKVLNNHGDKFLENKIELLNWVIHCYEKIGNISRVSFYKKMKQQILDNNNDL